MGWKEQEEQAIKDVKKLLARPNSPTSDYIGCIDEKTNEPEYFDPWDIFPVYGNYSSEFDDVALTVLHNLLDGTTERENIAHEMFREMLCKMDLCDYGTSPRVCFPNTEFRKLLPEYINKWKEYYILQWGDNDE